MKVLFLIATFNSKAKYHPGIASLSAFLKKAGHGTDFLGINSMDLSYVKASIKEYAPDVIAISTNSHQYQHIKELLPFIRSNFKGTKIIMGGVHPTLDENVINELEGLDAVLRGEGEMPLLRYVESIQNKKSDCNIPNITFRDKGTIKENKISYYVEDLDSLPYPDYSIFPRFKKPGKIDFPIRFLFNRGCPFKCTYCCNHKLKELFPQKKSYVRYKSPERVIEELLYFSGIYDFDHYVVDDDIFTLNKAWLLKLCNLYPESLKKKTFEVNVRVGTADREMLKALKDIGCSLVKIGVESGNELLRKEVLGRFISQDKIIETGEMIKSLGLSLHTFNMIGLPNETRQDVWKTIGLNRRLFPKKTQITVFYPYKNTILGERCINTGLIRKDCSDSYFSESILKLRPFSLSHTEISHYVDLFKFYVYSGKNNSIAKKAVASFIKKAPKKIAKGIYEKLNRRKACKA